MLLRNLKTIIIIVSKVTTRTNKINITYNGMRSTIYEIYTYKVIIYLSFHSYTTLLLARGPALCSSHWSSNRPRLDTTFSNHTIDSSSCFS